MPELLWLDDCSQVTNLRTDCINCFVGATEASYVGGGHGQYHNKIVDWINGHRLDASSASASAPTSACSTSSRPCCRPAITV